MPAPTGLLASGSEPKLAAADDDLGDHRHLLRVELDPDVVADVVNLARQGGHAQLQVGAIGAHDVVPCLTEVRALDDLASDDAAAGAVGERCRMELERLRAHREAHAAVGAVERRTEAPRVDLEDRKSAV